MQYRVEENADGSKTVWVGELEVRQRMRWAVGYTLRPGKAYLEASVRILNRTPVVNTMLCFANVAVHANEDYQVIFPPSTQYGTYHGKREFTKWPISDTIRGGRRLQQGDRHQLVQEPRQLELDLRLELQDDFFAGYDHGKQAGTMSVADHHIVPGKKFLTWGNGPAGRRWDHILTDDDGPYLELMVGAYSDNQPDYSWLQPYETRSFSMNWYPFREIGGVKKANLDAAVNLDVANGSAKVGFYTTSAHTAAKVLLKAGEKVLLQETVAIDPGKPYLKQVAASRGHRRARPGGLDFRRRQGTGLLLAGPPEARADAEAGHHAARSGRRQDQRGTLPDRPARRAVPRSAIWIPQPYWQEALRRDPGRRAREHRRWESAAIGRPAIARRSATSARRSSAPPTIHRAQGRRGDLLSRRCL